MDIESQLGTETDLVGDTLTMVDSGEPEVAQETEGQQEGESQTETTDDGGLDLESPQFAYTDEDGNEIQLTGQQIIDLLAEKQKAAEPKQEEPAKVEEPKQEAAKEEELPFTVDPIDFKRVGPDLVSMLSGENGGEEALGPAMAEFHFQTFLQDPRYAHAINAYVNTVLERREQQTKEVSSFQEFVGTKAEDTQIRDFQKANPWAKTKEMALMGIKLANTQAEIEKMKAGNSAAVKQAEQAGKKAGEKETIRNLRAKGTLRAIGQKATQTSQKGDDLKQKYDITDTDQRSRAMAEFIERMRGRQ